IFTFLFFGRVSKLALILKYPLFSPVFSIRPKLNGISTSDKYTGFSPTLYFNQYLNPFSFLGSLVILYIYNLGRKHKKVALGLGVSVSSNSCCRLFLSVFDTESY